MKPRRFLRIVLVGLIRLVGLASLATALVVVPTAPAWAQDATAPTAESSSTGTTPAPDPAEIVRYGVGLQMPRLVSVPSWMLGLFTVENVPLSTFGSFGVEVFRRRPDYDIVFAVTYQNMNPADGNWLGKGKEASVDTDFVQPRGVSLLGAEVSFVSRKMFSDYFGLHYGAGLGLAVVRGDVLRISNAGCTKANAGDEAACRPKVCEPNGCTEAILKGSEGGVDGGPSQPSRFKDSDIPGAFPILNLVVGLDFRIPDLVPGLEARLEGGFHDAFFVGTSFAYVFF
jgi:hypothetical protein